MHEKLNSKIDCFKSKCNIYSQKGKSLIIVVLLFIIAPIESFSQRDSTSWKTDTKEDAFWKPNAPIMDGFALWMLRQKLSIQGTQTILQSEMDLNNERINKIQLTNYLPIIVSKRINCMIGTRYSKYDLLSDNNSLNKSIQHVWLWSALGYKLGNWNFIITAENYFKGDESGLYDRVGNNFFAVSYIGYEFSPKWNLILMGGYDWQEMENAIKTKPLMGIQARYQPSARFKLLFGVPSIMAFEWTALKNTDIGFHYFISGNVSTFIQQRITEKLNISVHYNREINDDTFFNTNSFFSSSNDKIAFNNIVFTTSQLSAEIGFLTTNLLGINIGIGYNFKEKLSLFRENENINNNYRSKSFLTLNLRIQYLKH